LQLKVALIQQATALSNQQVLLETKTICSTVHEVISKVYKSLSNNFKITKEQMVCHSAVSLLLSDPFASPR
jgi:predicted RNA binding protein with dsRBD fold (UPF0201 family)